MFSSFCVSLAPNTSLHSLSHCSFLTLHCKVNFVPGTQQALRQIPSILVGGEGRRVSCHQGGEAILGTGFCTGRVQALHTMDLLLLLTPRPHWLLPTMSDLQNRTRFPFLYPLCVSVPLTMSTNLGCVAFEEILKGQNQG
jgi:hypothetical protein